MVALAQQFAGLRYPPLSSPLLSNRAVASKPRLSTAAVVSAATIFTTTSNNVQTRERQRLLELFEEVRDRCISAPVEGVSFTRQFGVPRRSMMALMLSSFIFSRTFSPEQAVALAEQPSLVAFREYLDVFDGYTFMYPQSWIQVRGAGADVFFRDPFILDENLSVELSSPSSSRYKSVEDLGTPVDAGEKVLRQYLTEFMSTRLGVRRESNVLSTSSRVADDGKLYYEVEVNIKSYANNNELAVRPQDRIARLEWDRRYLSVLGVENSQLYELRLQAPENMFLEEEKDLRQVMDSFRVLKAAG